LRRCNVDDKNTGVRIVTYTAETKAERIVCLDGLFRCPNPACGYTSPFRAWGKGFATNKVTSRLATVKIPGEMQMATKRNAEQQAWADAQSNYQRVTCPRCMRGANPSIQFANP
jgi:hypothetical protein